MPGAGVPTLLVGVTETAPLDIAAANRAATREVEVVLELARPHRLEMAGARVPALVARVPELGASAPVRVVGIGSLVVDLRGRGGGDAGEQSAGRDGDSLHGVLRRKSGSESLKTGPGAARFARA